jgi:hypothetical protein
MTWQSAPICYGCWAEEVGGRPPVRIKDPDIEECYLCGRSTLSGIYVRRGVEES